MPAGHDPNSLLELQRELDAFLRSLAHPVVVEDEVELFDLTAARWKLTVEFGKLLFEAWNAAALHCAARGRRRVSATAAGLASLCASRADAKPAHSNSASWKRPERAGRTRYGTARAFAASSSPCWSASIRAGTSSTSAAAPTASTRSPSGTRGAWLGRAAPAGRFSVLEKQKHVAAADGALAHGLIWLDWLRSPSTDGLRPPFPASSCFCLRRGAALPRIAPLA